MHAMRPQFRAKGTVKFLPESRGWNPKPEEAGGRLKGVFHPSFARFPVDAMKNGKSRSRREERRKGSGGQGKKTW